MKTNAITLLLFISIKLAGQAVDPVQVEWNGQLYWKYIYVDQYNNTPYVYNYLYDSLGNYLGRLDYFPKDGAWIGFFQEDSSKVASIFHIKHGALNGKSTQYHLNGQIQSEYQFRNRVEDGYVRYWNDKGILTLEHQFQYKDFGHFKASIGVGEWKDWDDDGQLIWSRHYQEGELHGRHLEFYPNGQIKVVQFFKLGEKDSTYTSYHSNGQVFKQLRYKDGVFIEDNPSYEYHPNGKISGTGNLIQNLKDGPWKYFYDNGALESEGKYGTYIYPHEHGDMFYQHKQGLWTYWYPNGKIKATGTYDETQVQTLEIGVEAIGLRKDDWKYFDEQGVEITLEEFLAKGLEIKDY